MKKVTALLIVGVMLLSLLSACGSEKSETVNMAILAGPTGIGAAKLMQDNADGISENKYNFTVFSATDEVTAKVISGELDIAAVPTNLASVLYKKTNGGVKIAALNTLGVLYLLTAEGTTVTTVEDLKGKTVYTAGKGGVPEYALDYILDSYGIRNEVEIVFEAEHDVVVSDLAAGKASVAMLPEPKVTAALSKVEGLQVALDITDEWEKATANEGGESELAMGCVVVNSDFAENNPSAVNSFLSEYKASIEYMNDSANAETAATLCETYGIIAKAAVAKKVIPNCNMVFIEGGEMKAKAEGFLQTLLEYNPASIGGEMPNDEFYYAR